MNEPEKITLQMGHCASYPSTSVKEWNEAVESLNKWAEGLKPLSDHLSNVRDFTTTFGQPAPDKPTVLSTKLGCFRHNLLIEESTELVHANTLISCLDAVCDQLYVVLGNAVACGFSAEQINRGLTEVHRSNMTKLWTGEEFESASLPDGATGHVVADDRYIVRSSDGKILKPPGYSPADLSWIEREGK